MLLLQSLRAEAEKAADALREELDKAQRAAAKQAAEDAAAHDAEVARLSAEHERAQVAEHLFPVTSLISSLCIVRVSVGLHSA